MNSIRHTYFYQQAPAAVWAYLTEAELLAQWLMPNDFRPEIGHEFTFRTRPMPAFDFDGIVYCKVLELQPYKRLSYSWKGGPRPGEITLDTLVEWELHEKDNGTELRLNHSGFQDRNTMIFGIMDGGWLKNMGEIATLLNKATV
ncbi:SRPBCC domain-containing protein [Chitinophaga sp. sic0106]|uniref:SRPBCC family protein n=1 Tax=Chitinophaga sp. sic0106 TaxID=2854785 RepID=UPI001C489FCF|nr:SRPBCC domain-containing protein [Chitinophaga sp. sic0106]MBV7529866.1 SRPBCC domain-containing protein [Chitinophaga sp. sic0106]